MTYFFNLNKNCLAYASTTLGASIMHNVFMFYYVKVFLHHFRVSEWWFQFSQIVFMVWNMLNDPIFGYLQDNVKLRCLRSRRLSILYGGPLFALSFIIPWFAWRSYSSGDWLCGIHLLLALNFYDTMFTFVLLAHCALFAEMGINFEDRMRMKWYGAIAALLASVACPLVNFVSQNLTNFTRFQLTCVGLALFAHLCMRYTGHNAHTVFDNPDNCSSDAKTKEAQFSPWRLTWQIMCERDFLAFVFTNFLQIFHSTFLANFLSIFVDELVPLDSTMKSLFYGVLFTGGSMIVVVARPLIESCGYYRLLRAGILWKIFSSLLLLLLGVDNIVLYLLFVTFDSCVAQASFNLYDLVLSDVIDKDRRRYAREHPLSSMVFATNALITKPAISLAPMMVVPILNRYGYAQLIDKVVSTPTSIGIERMQLRSIMFTLSCVIPLTIGLLQIITWSFFTIRKSHLRSETTDLQPSKEIVVIT